MFLPWTIQYLAQTCLPPILSQPSALTSHTSVSSYCKEPKALTKQGIKVGDGFLVFPGLGGLSPGPGMCSAMHHCAASALLAEVEPAAAARQCWCRVQACRQGLVELHSRGLNEHVWSAQVEP